MKKILLASSALVAVAFAGTSASAAERLTASVAGYMFVGMGYSDVGNGNGLAPRSANVDDFGVLRDGEIHFNFRGTSDNGLTFDGRVELEAWSQGGDMIDENWARVSGSFGSLKFGGDDHASYNLSTGILFFAGAHIGHYDSFNESGTVLNGTGGGQITNNRFSDQIGIAYNTPVFSGFQAQVSYHPSQTSDNITGDTNSLKFGDSDIISVGLNYQATFSDVNVRLSGGYDYVDSFNGGGDEDAFMAGIQFGYLGFVLGAHYKEALTSFDSEDWLINVGYTAGPWNFGLGYVYADGTLVGTGFGGVPANAAETDRFAGWVNYALAPGVSVGAGVEYQDTSVTGATGSEGVSGKAILSLSF